MWATVTTFLGSLTAVLLASQLLKAFSGKQLVSDSLAANPEYGAAVALGAGLTVLSATKIGFPISTTHSLVGALVGAGWAAGSPINFSRLGSGYFKPLLLSPVLAIAATVVCYSVFKFLRRRVGVTEQTCLCVGNETLEIVPSGCDAAVLQRVERLTATIGDVITCKSRYQGRLLGIEAAAILDGLHFLTAGMVSFARGLNDTPKIAAVLLLTSRFGSFGSTTLVGVFIALGGIISARRVAETMSKKITPMNHGQGFTANLVTGLIVIGASCTGMPVSTTHVSCGSLFGIGTVTRQGELSMIGKILGAWIATLPVGALLGAASYWAIRSL